MLITVLDIARRIHGTTLFRTPPRPKVTNVGELTVTSNNKLPKHNATLLCQKLQRAAVAAQGCCNTRPYKAVRELQHKAVAAQGCCSTRLLQHTAVVAQRHRCSTATCHGLEHHVRADRERVDELVVVRPVSILALQDIPDLFVRRLK